MATVYEEKTRQHEQGRPQAGGPQPVRPQPGGTRRAGRSGCVSASGAFLLVMVLIRLVNLARERFADIASGAEEAGRKLPDAAEAARNALGFQYPAQLIIRICLIVIIIEAVLLAVIIIIGVISGRKEISGRKNGPDGEDPGAEEEV